MMEFTSSLDLFAACYAKIGDVPLERARDLVILRCLEAGDPSAFAYFEMAGHRPGPEVLRALAIMTSEGKVPSDVAERFPFRLVATNRQQTKLGRRTDPLKEMAREVVALNVHGLMGEDRGKYDAAIAEVAALISDGKKGKSGDPIKQQTVRDGYDKHFSRRSR